MIGIKELIVLITSALVLGYLTQFPQFAITGWLMASSLALLMLAVNTFGYKVAARFFDSNAEIHHWNIYRYGLNSTRNLKHPVPAWAILPLGLIFITWGWAKWLAVTIFDVVPLKLRARRVFSRVSEWDAALIGISGLFLNILLAFASKLLGYPDFARLNLYFVLFNLIPLGTLTGNRIFFGSKYLWIFAAIFTLAVLVLMDMTTLIGVIALAILLALGAVGLFYSLIEA